MNSAADAASLNRWDGALAIRRDGVIASVPWTFPSGERIPVALLCYKDQWREGADAPPALEAVRESLLEAGVGVAALNLARLTYASRGVSWWEAEWAALAACVHAAARLPRASGGAVLVGFGEGADAILEATGPLEGVAAAVLITPGDRAVGILPGNKRGALSPRLRERLPLLFVLRERTEGHALRADVSEDQLRAALNAAPNRAEVVTIQADYWWRGRTEEVALFAREFLLRQLNTRRLTA